MFVRQAHWRAAPPSLDADLPRSARDRRVTTSSSRAMSMQFSGLLPVEADGRLRYRIKSKEENFERIVTKDTLSRLN
jgi:hypothetical protein